MENKYNYVYEIKDHVNEKTYIGARSTNNLNDGYMGGGLYLNRAKKKYGYKNFTKIIMSFFDTRAEAFEEEEYLVNQDWVDSNSNYNMQLGGLGGFAQHKGYKVKDTSRMNIDKIGKPRTEEVKKRISETTKKNHWTKGPNAEAIKLKLSIAGKGKIPWNKKT